MTSQIWLYSNFVSYVFHFPLLKNWAFQQMVIVFNSAKAWIFHSTLFENPFKINRNISINPTIILIFVYPSIPVAIKFGFPVPTSSRTQGLILMIFLPRVPISSRGFWSSRAVVPPYHLQLNPVAQN